MLSSKHGTVTFLENRLKAAQQAAADLAAVQASIEAARGAGGVAGVAGIVGAVAGVIGAGFEAGSFGTSLAGLIKGAGGAGGMMDSLQVEIANLTAVPIVLFNYDVANCNIASLCDPLLPGETDFVLVTSAPGTLFGNNTVVELSFLVGTGADASVVTKVRYNLTDTGDPGRWQVHTEVDGKELTFADKLELRGATFAGNSGYPSFSFYTSPIETNSGRIDVNFYELSSAASAARKLRG